MVFKTFNFDYLGRHNASVFDSLGGAVLQCRVTVASTVSHKNV